MTYDPNLGRWLEEDPIGFDAGDTNLYRMEGNNPINEVDPSGFVGLADPPFGWFPDERAPDYEGLDSFPMQGWIFYKGYIERKYGDRWESYKLGCLGLAKCRLGVPDHSSIPGSKYGTNFNLFHPDIVQKYKVKCFKDYKSASVYFNSLKGKPALILAAQFDDFKNSKAKPVLGPNEVDPNSVPTIGSGNYATLQYGARCKSWYWEWMGTGEGGNDFNVKHRRFQPEKEQLGLPSDNKHTVYCVYTFPPK